MTEEANSISNTSSLLGKTLDKALVRQTLILLYC